MTWTHGGTGTDIDPYLVPDADALDDVRDYWGAGVYFLQTADIDLTDYQAGAGWVPFTTDPNNRFSAHYDGDNFNIYNLLIVNHGARGTSLFGRCSGTLVNIKLSGNVTNNQLRTGILTGDLSNGHVENCHIEGNLVTTDRQSGGLTGVCEGACNIVNCSVDAEVTGGTLMGLFAGVVRTSTNFTDCYAKGELNATSGGGFVGEINITTFGTGGEFTNCHTNADVNVTTGQAGGFAHYNYRGTFIKCSASGNVISGGNDIGGFIGRSNNNGLFESCFASGDVQGEEKVGGFAGIIRDSVNVRNCYAKGDVTGDLYVGGLIGDIRTGAVVYNSYSIGKPTGNSEVGGLVGHKESGTTTNSYWDIETSEIEVSDSGEGKTTAEMNNIDIFNTWDISTTDIQRNDGYPFLGWEVNLGDFVWYISEPSGINSFYGNRKIIDAYYGRQKIDKAYYGKQKLYG